MFDLQPAISYRFVFNNQFQEPFFKDQLEIIGRNIRAFH